MQEPLDLSMFVRRDAGLSHLDLAVEGIVDRMSGLTRRFKRSLNDVLAEHGLTFEEWDVLGALRRAGPPFRRSAGELAKFSELSSGAMTAAWSVVPPCGVRILAMPSIRGSAAHTSSAGSSTLTPGRPTRTSG